ncbi:MAG: hypothetical protein ACOYMG_15125 [Candidatus Methylumidiphilus sp.]
MAAILIVDPSWVFADMHQSLVDMGWRLVNASSQPLLPGEPEYAIFERHHNERIHYTFNPVCNLRVLEGPSALDANSLTGLKVADNRDIESWLASTDERTVLRGVLASGLLPDSKLLARIEDLCGHPRSAIAQTASRVLGQFRHTDSFFTQQTIEANPAMDGDGGRHPSPSGLGQSGEGIAGDSQRMSPDEYARAFQLQAAEAARLSLRNKGFATGEDASGLLVLDAESAVLAAHEPENLAFVASLLREATSCGVAAALCVAQPSGFVEVQFNDGTQQRFHAGEPASMGPQQWWLAVSLASCINDMDALGILCHKPNLLSCLASDKVAAPFWVSACLAIAAFHQGEEKATELLRKALAEIAPHYPSIDSLDFTRGILARAIALSLHLTEHDGDGWDSILHAEVDAQTRHFGFGNGFGESVRVSIFAIGGICAAAKRRGMAPKVIHAGHSQPLLPMLTSEIFTKPKQSGLLFAFPPMRLFSKDEAEWFLDMHGFPFEARTHRNVVHGDSEELINRSSGAPGLPLTETHFFLFKPDAPSNTLPLALDAGQLLHLYGILRSGIQQLSQGDELTRIQLRAYLLEADVLLNALDARFPANGDLMDTGELTSRLGREMMIAAPECFSRIWVAGQRKWLEQYLIPPASNEGSNSRDRALASIEILREQVTPLLRALSHDRSGDILQAVRPRDEDYAKVFAASVSEFVKEAYTKIWEQSAGKPFPDSAQTQLVCHIAPAGMLTEDNELSLHFPGGYRAVARLLNPHRVWVRWKFCRPGESIGMAYDGMVWIDDHWAWFPKAYRVLESVAGNTE